MNSLLIRNTTKRHYDLHNLPSDVVNFDSALPTSVSFCADVDAGSGCGDAICMTVTVSQDGEVIAVDTPKQFKPNATPPIVVDGILYANQVIAEKLHARRVKTLELIAADDFLHIPRTGEKWKIKGLGDDFCIEAVDEWGCVDCLDPITTPVEPHSGWNWRGRD